MLLLLCNKSLLFDLFLATSAFWGNALFDFLQNSWNWHLCKISVFLSEFSKPKMILELPNKSRWFECSMGKHQTGNLVVSLHMSLFLSSQSSSFSSCCSPEPSFFSSLFFHIHFYFLKHQPSGAFTLNRVTVAPREVMSDSLWNKRQPITVSSVLQLLHNSSKERH